MEKDSFANHLKNKDSQNILEGVINELVRMKMIIFLLQLDPKLLQNLYVIVHLRRNFLLF